MRFPCLRGNAPGGRKARSAGAGRRCARARHVVAQGARAHLDQALRLVHVVGHRRSIAQTDDPPVGGGGGGPCIPRCRASRAQTRGGARAVAPRAPHRKTAEARSGTSRIHGGQAGSTPRSEEHTSELQSQSNLVCRLLLEKKKKK